MVERHYEHTVLMSLHYTRYCETLFDSKFQLFNNGVLKILRQPEIKLKKMGKNKRYNR